VSRSHHRWLPLLLLVLMPVLEAEAAPAAPCLSSLSVSSSTSLLERLREAGGSAPDFPETVASRTIDAQTDKPLPTLGSAPDGAALFWMGADKKPVVDARVLGPLQTAHVTRLKPGQSVEVGRVVDPAATPLAQVSELLIRAGIILTYVHVGAELCVAPQSTQERRIYSGTHTYFTNTENNEPVRFSVVLGSGGVIRVQAN
jgi:hypothetical protein